MHEQKERRSTMTSKHEMKTRLKARAARTSETDTGQKRSERLE